MSGHSAVRVASSGKSLGEQGIGVRPVGIRPAAPVSGPTLQYGERNPLRVFAVYLALACIFIRFSMISEVLQMSLGVNTYLLYLMAPPAILAVLATEGMRRTFRSKAPLMLVGFFFWMVMTIPTSFWPGASFKKALSYMQTELFMVFIVAGLVVSWGEVRKVFYVMALSGAFNLLTARLFLKEDNGRMSLSYGGLISNSNDLAAHLLLMAPFLLFVILDKKRTFIFKAIAFGLIGYAVYVIVGTGSRGGLVALGLGVLFYLTYASMLQRVMIVFLLPVLILPLLLMLPAETRQRLSSMFGEQHSEAQESAQSREYLFRQSVAFTIKHPIFGVGLDQFTNYEGSTMTRQGLRGNWHAAHCTWTQVSSETGIPGMIFFVSSLVIAVKLVMKLFREAKRRKDTEISNLCFCYLLAMVLYLTSISFLSSAYTFRQPALIGMGVVIYYAGRSRLGIADWGSKASATA